MDAYLFEGATKCVDSDGLRFGWNDFCWATLCTSRRLQIRTDGRGPSLGMELGPLFESLTTIFLA